jgi:abortive infection bacteriophage resistance protein
MSSSGSPKVPYGKPWLSHADQVNLLVNRGLVVTDRAAAEAFLAHVNYYRFSGYVEPFERARHALAGACSFEAVRATYDFDLVLRDLVTDALEILEVDVRATIASHFGLAHGAFGHTDARNFFHTFRHADWLAKRHEEAERSSETFVGHMRTHYSDYPNLPIWMLTEVMSFGALSQVYKGMHRQDQRAVAARYRMQASDLGGVLHHLAYVRNLCAHHARLWNRAWAIRPSLPRGRDWLPPRVPASDRLFASLLVQHHLMRQCSGVRRECTQWRDRLLAHLDAPPPVPDALPRMGLPTDWRSHPVWQ